MAEKDWFDKAKEAFAEGTGAVVGAALGATEEAASFLGEAPSAIMSYADKGMGQFRQFGLGLEQMQKGNLDITKQPDWSQYIQLGKDPSKWDAEMAAGQAQKKAERGGLSLQNEETKPEVKPQGGGKERVLQGLFGSGGPSSKIKDNERLFSVLPTYEATKKDLLNIGEGLVDLVGLASGIGGQEKKEAVTAQSKRKLGSFETGLKAGKETGEELVGGLLSTGIVLGGGLTGGEGKRLVQEAPITYALNALPILSKINSAIKSGAINKIRAAEIEGQVRSMGYASLDDLQNKIKTTVDAADRERLAGQATEAVGKGVAEAEVPKYFQEGTAPLARAFRAATEVGSGAAKALPYTAAAYALGGAPAALLVGGLAASPLLAKFMPAGAAATVKRKTAPFRRKVVEPRSYETPAAQEMGEELLRTEGETAVISDRLQPFVQKAETAEISPQQTKEQLASQYENTYKQEQNLNQIIQDSQDPQIISAATIKLQNLPAERSRLNALINAADPTGQVLTQQQIEQLGRQTQTTPMVVDFNEQGNARLLTEFDDAVRGTELENLTPDEKKATVKSVIVARQSPNVWLADDALRQKVADRIQQLTGIKLKGDAKTILDNTLYDISSQAFNKGEPILLDVPLDNVLKPLAQQKLLPSSKLLFVEPNSGTVIVNADVPSLGQITREIGGVTKDFSPVPAIMKRLLEKTQTGLRERVVKPYVSPIAESNPQATLAILTDQFKQGDLSLPTAVKFDPQPVINLLRREAVEVTDPALRGNADYKKYLNSVADRLETMKTPKVSLGDNVRVPESVSSQPNLTNQYDYGLKLAEQNEGKLSSGLGLMRRLATIYNPMTGLGNYLGNALVRMMNTGSPTPNSSLANGLVDVVRKVTKEPVPPEVALRNELVLRAVPSQDILSVAETNSNLSKLERTKGFELWRKGYQYGDTVFRIDEATRQAKNLIEEMNNIPQNGFNRIMVGPNVILTVQRVGNEFVFINPENGKILTRGPMQSPAVKRIMGSAIKASVDNLYPDVRELPSYFASLNGKGGIASKIASAGVVFQPFLSYIVKASDTPWKRGILTTLVEQSPASPLVDRTYGGWKMALDQAGRYFGSRGLLNGINARFNNLSAEERDMLRKMYAFSPSKQKPVIFGSLVDLSNGDRVRRTFTPQFANFWEYSDDALRGLAWVGHKFENLYKQDINPDNSNAMDAFANNVIEGKGVTAMDALRATATAGGLLLPLYRVALESEKFGKPDVGIKDAFKPFGILGRIGVIVGEQTFPNVFEQKTPYLKPLVNNFATKMFDTIIGTQLSTEMQPEKATNFLNQVYNEYYRNVVKPLADEANLALAEGDYSTASQKQMAAEQLNDNLITVIKNRAESYNEAFYKLGLGKGIASKGLRFQHIKQKEVPVELEPAGNPEPMPELPKESGDFVPPTGEE